MGPDNLYFSKYKPLKAYIDLDLYPTLPNIELVQAFSYATMDLNFMFLNRLFLQLLCNNMDRHTHSHTHVRTHTHTQTNTHTHTHTHTLMSTLQLHFAKSQL